MLIVETIRKVRLALEKGESQRSVAKKYRLSRTTVGKIASCDETEFKYTRRQEVQYPALGSFIERLIEILRQEAELPAKRRRTVKKIHEELQREGYSGSYDAVRRYSRTWKEEHRSRKSAYIPLQFAKAEAFQFDWSEETVKIGGVVRKLQVAQVRLCYSRMRFCVAFERQELAMVMEAHIRAHEFFGGLCERGIYDNPKTIVQEICPGKEREYNKRFLQLSSHYLFEPCACTPAAGWEKGQVENQVGTNRASVFVPCLKFENLAELNAHLEEQMLALAYTCRHPEFQDKTVFEVFEEEKPYLRRQKTLFSGYTTAERRASVQCLVRFDGTNYSIPCDFAGKHVSIRIFAERLVFAVDGKTVAEHVRNFEKGRYVLDPLHYLPLLERKPGALRNGRPFLDWELPESVRKVWEALRRYPDWDRQMSAILSTVPRYGLEAVGIACEMALEEKAVSQSVILNFLTRLTEESQTANIAVPDKLRILEEPRSDCKVYDVLLRGKPCCARVS
ncbi:MAG: IS21 family transposase [Synergistaceae bacterium]|nr:IS21 family transposase [Synergistaceae bacterium]